MTDRELDALVAEKVMGLVPHGRAPVSHYDGEATVHAPGHGWDDHDEQPIFAVPGADPEMDRNDGDYPDQHFNGKWTGNLMECPRYPTTGDGMLAVIEKMRERGFIEFVAFGFHGSPDRRRASFSDPARCSRGDTDAETLPRAVCLAALKALGVEV